MKILKILFIIIMLATIIFLYNTIISKINEKNEIEINLKEKQEKIEDKDKTKLIYEQTKQELEQLKILKEKEKEKYDKVNQWNQEIKSYLE